MLGSTLVIALGCFGKPLESKHDGTTLETSICGISSSIPYGVMSQ